MARRSEHTKEQLQSIIVDMGEKIISENGLKALTARRLSQNIGYTVGTLYNKFSNLDQIILHVNAKTLDKMIPVLNIASAGGVIPLAIAYL